MKNIPEQRKTRATVPKINSQAEDNKRLRAASEASSIPYHKAQLTIKEEELRERFLFIIGGWAADKYRYEWLENHTGIPAARWQNVMLEKQLPTLDMLIAVCKHRPNYTFWLMHGTHEKWVIEPSKHLWYKLEGPTEEIMNKFRTDHEWIKERRKINMAAKKSAD